MRWPGIGRGRKQGRAVVGAVERTQLNRLRPTPALRQHHWLVGWLDATPSRRLDYGHELTCPLRSGCRRWPLVTGITVPAKGSCLDDVPHSGQLRHLQRSVDVLNVAAALIRGV
jgi:hypothetical protein